MRTTLTFLFLLICISVSAQFRMVGNADGPSGWTTVNDSTYTASITFQSDLTGKGYLATQIADTFRVFTPTEQEYRVSAVADQTFNSATLTVVERNGTNGQPIGQIMVYNPDGKSSIPQAPFGSTGSTAQMQAAIDTYNARLTGIANAADVTTAQLADTARAVRNYADDQIKIIDTISQLAHGFSVGDPVWKSGDYVLARDTGLSVTVSGIVIDSVNANTFYVQRNGVFTLTGHGFTVDQQLYVQPDGSYSAADTVNSLVYGFAIDANTIQIGVKPAAVLTLANAFNNSISGLSATTKSGAINELKDTTETAPIEIKGAISEIATKSLIAGDKILWKSALYEVEDTTYLLADIAANRNWGTTDNAARIQLANSKYAHLKPQNGRVPVSVFIDAYSSIPSYSNQRYYQVGRSYAAFDDTEAVQRGLDYVARHPEANTLFLDVPFVVLTDTIVIEYGATLEGQYTGGGFSFNQTPKKGVVFLNLNDSAKEAIQFSKTSSGGYLSNTGLIHTAIIALSPAKCAVAMYENANSQFHDNLIMGINQGISGTRLLDYGIIAYGVVSTDITKVEIGHCAQAAFKVAEYSYPSTTLRLKQTHFIRSGNGIDISDNTTVTCYSCIIEVVDTSSLIIRSGNFVAYDWYNEDVPSDDTHTEAAIRVLGEVDKINIYTANVSGANPAALPNSRPFIAADSVRNITLRNALVVGFEYLITTTANTGVVTLDNQYDWVSVKSPVSGDYTGINAATKVNCIGCESDLTDRSVVNILPLLQADKPEIDEGYQTRSWLDGTNFIENLTLVSRTENLIRASEAIPATTDTYWTINPARVTITANDTLYEGSAIAEKLVKAGASTAFVQATLDSNYLVQDEHYVFSFYYATSSFSTINIIAGSNTAETLLPISTNSDWIRYEYPFTYTSTTASNFINVQFNGSTGDSIYITRFQLERTGKLETAASTYNTTTTSTYIADPTIGINSGKKLVVSGNSQTTGIMYDSDGDAGTAGQLYMATGSGTNWSSPSYGEAYVDYVDPDTVTVVTAGTLYDLTDVTESSSSSDVTVSTTTGRLTYTGTTEKLFAVTWTATVTCNANNENLIGTVLDNGATITRIRWEEEDTASGDTHSVAASGFFSMGQNDWVQPKITAESNGTQVRIITMSFKIQEVR